jgi:hypothetical protein
MKLSLGSDDMSAWLLSTIADAGIKVDTFAQAPTRFPGPGGYDRRLGRSIPSLFLETDNILPRHRPGSRIQRLSHKEANVIKFEFHQSQPLRP